jgi:hypothetical protein
MSNVVAGIKDSRLGVLPDTSSVTEPFYPRPADFNPEPGDGLDDFAGKSVTGARVVRLRYVETRVPIGPTW